MRWLVQKSVLLLVAVAAGFLAWKTEPLAVLMGQPSSSASEPFPLSVYVGGVVAGVLLNEIVRTNWSRFGVQLAHFLRTLGANAALAAIGFGCAFFLLYS